jgi:hypothetical protein
MIIFIPLTLGTLGTFTRQTYGGLNFRHLTRFGLAFRAGTFFEKDALESFDSIIDFSFHLC